MFKRKKTAALIAAISVCLTLLASCGSNGDSGSDAKSKVTVSASEQTTTAESIEDEGSSVTTTASAGTITTAAESVTESKSDESVHQISADWTDLNFVFDDMDIIIGTTTIGDMYNSGWRFDDMVCLMFIDETYSTESLAFKEAYFAKDNYMGYNTSDDSLSGPQWFNIIRADFPEGKSGESVVLSDAVFNSFACDIYYALTYGAAYPAVAFQENITWGSTKEEITAVFSDDFTDGNDSALSYPTESYEMLCYRSDNKCISFTVSDAYGLVGFHVYLEE